MTDPLLDKLRNLTPYDILGANLSQSDFDEHWATLIPDEQAKLSGACSRIQLVEAIQHEARFTDLWDRVQSQALQIYLLCTCFDVLAGQATHKDFVEWVREQGDKLADLVSPPGSLNHPMTIERFSALVEKLHKEWTGKYGVSRNFRQFLIGLPHALRIELITSYAITKAGEPIQDWKRLSDDKKLRRVTNYLFARRNKFTHSAKISPTLTPTVGISGLVWFTRETIEGKDFDVYFAKTDETHGETSLLRIVLIGALRHLVGYEADRSFLDLHWEIERYKRQFRDLYAELTRNERVSFIYFREDAPNLADQPHRGLWHLKDNAAQTLHKHSEIDLAWFGADNARIRETLSDYLGIVAQINLAIAQYEQEGRNLASPGDRKVSAYKAIRQQMRESQLQNMLVQLAMAIDSMLNTAPQIVHAR